MVTLTTDRTVLALATAAHAAPLADYFARNRAHFARWDPPRPLEFYTTPWWLDRIAADTQLSAEDRGYRFVVSPRGHESAAIGMVHFSNVIRGAFHSSHLGFNLDAAHEGRGYMREALERLITWAFDDLRLHRVEANHRPENTRSAAVLRRLGFTPVGYARDYLLIDGAWRDHVLTARVNDRWQPPA